MTLAFSRSTALPIPQRFLVVNTAVPTPLPVTVVSDWTAALKK